MERSLEHPLKPHRGGVVATLGVIGLALFFPLALVAWWMGRKDLKEMDRGTMDPSGRTATQVGWTLGVLVLWLFLAGLAAAAVILGTAGAGWMSNG